MRSIVLLLCLIVVENTMRPSVTSPSYLPCFFITSYTSLASNITYTLGAIEACIIGATPFTPVNMATPKNIQAKNMTIPRFSAVPPSTFSEEAMRRRTLNRSNRGTVKDSQSAAALMAMNHAYCLMSTSRLVAVALIISLI
jgi:hypothetical protein